MNPNFALQLSQWLARTDIGYLELQGPQGCLRLLNHDGQVKSTTTDHVADTGLAVEPITAPSVGILLLSHPLHDAPLAPTGQPVAEGQVIALLRVGGLLLPVVAPANGVLLRFHAAHGTTVGWGTPLADLQPATRSGAARGTIRP